MSKALIVACAWIVTLFGCATGYAAEGDVRSEQVTEWFEAAERLQLAGSSEEAICTYQRILVLVPDNPVVFSKLGKIFYQAEDFSAAAEHYSRAAELEPENASYHNDAGLAQWRAGDPQRGIKSLKRATELDPKKLRYANNLSTVYVDIGEDAKALAAQRAAHSNLASVHYNMAYLFDKNSLTDKAREHVEKALEYDPGLGRAQRLRDKITRMQ